MTQYGFCIDLDTCAGCKACAMACKDKNNLDLGIKYRKIYDCASGTWETINGVPVPSGVFSYSVSLACNHCAHPACVDQCPTGAMTKDSETGIVTSDEEVCIGCGTCVNVCPYNAPRIIGETPHSGKCDMCVDLINQNENPRCVDACIMRCLTYGDIEDLRAAHGSVADVEPLVSSSETGPSLVIINTRFNPEGTAPVVVTNLAEELL